MTNQPVTHMRSTHSKP